MVIPDQPQAPAHTGELISALSSRDTSARRAAATGLENSSEPDVPAALIGALESAYGHVVRQAVEILTARADPAALVPLQDFVASSSAFDNVVRARLAIDAILGVGERRRPTAADFSRLYGPMLVLESLTWSEHRAEGNSFLEGDDLVVVVMPSFHPELAVSFSDDRAVLWLRHDSLWRTIQSGAFGATGVSSVLTEDPSEMDLLRRLAAQGLDEPHGGVGIDGVVFGGLRRVGGDTVEFPGRSGRGRLLRVPRRDPANWHAVGHDVLGLSTIA